MTRSLHSACALSLALLAGTLTACSTSSTTNPGQLAAQPTKARLFDGLGNHTRKVTTSSPDAQRYFNQGLNWMYSFNHDEAIRSFEEAVRLDPGCAMAYWGIALCHGPHINAPVMTEDSTKAAWSALQKAKDAADNATPVEKALIDALASRYIDPASAKDGKLPLTFDERSTLDKAYAEAMSRVYDEHKDDADVCTLYAESLMDLRPWDLYEVGTAAPRPETPRVLEALELALKINPNHPGACHYYIHAVEASSTPEKASAVADRLRTLVPASGHMVHMPSHIDVRTGKWALAAEQNRKANKVDDEYRKLSPKQGLYRLYMAHDDHFLAYACMMLGRREEALKAAADMVRKIPADFVKDMAPFVDAYTPIGSEVMVRFGMWDEILASPKPPEHLPITVALWHFARAAAHNAKGNTSLAREEQRTFRTHIKTIPQEAMMAQNPAHKVLEIADHTLEGEILFREGKTDDAVASLKKAIAIEDTLRYIEPPDWVQPVRHSLGAVLLAADRPQDAEAVYREDLKIWPENGWALYGLSQSLKAQNKDTAEIDKRFKEAWKHADTKLHASCLCVPTK
ncbi:MAG TPA: tetratricopeptide repeat protein [Phycisphaerales bacterium]|nr:tetratricopeptide repeat protein [Phycisphaerales bacterium]